MIEVHHDRNYLEGNFRLPKNALAAQYLEWIAPGTEEQSGSENVKTVKEYAVEENPFITIVTRTQGTRIEALSEMLLCVSGQSDRDFDLCVVGHNIDDEKRDTVLTLIDSQPLWLRDKIKFMTVTGGSRSKPLNIAFASARTDYVTILDDDDLVFDNWIESFHHTAQEHFGSIVFSYVFTQKWEVTTLPSGMKQLRAAGSPTPDYCSDFDVFRQVVVNYCPTMGLAFPVFVFRDCGLRFDEALTTTEDWDFLMRASFICGVSNSHEPVAIYRLWENAGNSHSLHSEVEWERNRIIIQKKLAGIPLLLPVGSAKTLIARAAGAQEFLLIDPDDAKLYYDDGSGFSERSIAKTTSSSYDAGTHKNILEFEDLEKLGGLQGIRFDPCDNGPITISDLKIEVHTIDSRTMEFSQYDIEYNGISPKDGVIAFAGCDPQALVRLSTPETTDDEIIDSVEVSFKLQQGVNIPRFVGARSVMRFKEKLRRRAHKERD